MKWCKGKHLFPKLLETEYLEVPAHHKMLNEMKVFSTEWKWIMGFSDVSLNITTHVFFIRKQAQALIIYTLFYF